jgi:deoxyxylulose-5-phosphate synthase
MARFYASVSDSDLSRVEDLLKRGCIEYSLQILGDGARLKEIRVAEEDPEAAEALGRKGFSVGVVNARFIKPLDAELITSVANKTGRLVTVEENALQGEFGGAVWYAYGGSLAECDSIGQ